MSYIGIVGGLSYESTLHYYERINRQVNERVGGLASAELSLRSVNFERYYRLMQSGDWHSISKLLANEIRHLWFDGCQHIAIASNTMHKAVEEMKEWLPDFSLVHIGDCIADECHRIGAVRVLLLGTKLTMMDDFMKKHLEANGLEVMSTNNYPEEVTEIDRIIFEELCHGIVTLESKEFLMNFVWQFPSDSDERPEAIILGCTELEMILEPEDIDIPLVNSTQAHIDTLVDLCLAELLMES